MSEQLLTVDEQTETLSQTACEIGRGNHGTVHLDSESMVVTKHLSIVDRERAAILVRREHSYLERLSAALQGERYLDCPKPVGVEPEQGTVRMSYCPGERLDYALIEGNPAVVSEIDHIAEQIATGISRYVEEFGEPYFSLSTNNMVFDASSRVLYLIDFSSGRTIPGINVKEVPFEVTLGCFLGVTTYHTVRIRPAMWLRQDYWRRQRAFSVAVVNALFANRVVSPDIVRRVANETYKMLAINGRPLRRAWYSTLGRILFNRRVETIMARVDQR